MADLKVRKLLKGTLNQMNPDQKRSFKCPTAIYNYKSLVRLEKLDPKTKLIVGMRHPVHMLQSFYNYRVTEIKERGLDHPIPSLEQVLARDTPWKGVSMQSTRFDLFLMQMGKAPVKAHQLEELANTKYDLAIKPTNFKVFLYTLDQIEDEDQVRSESVRTELQNYLGLNKPIQPFSHENKTHVAHKESVDICDDKWASVRQELVEQGAKTAAWIREHFMHSDDVIVANPEHFVQSLESWGVDPCIATTTASA